MSLDACHCKLLLLLLLDLHDLIDGKQAEYQLITVFDASEFVNKKGGEIVVTGYTQKAESRFKGLAEKRAQAVAKILTEQYGVPSERITVEYKSDSEAPFSGKSTAWNRVVIIRSK